MSEYVALYVLLSDGTCWNFIVDAGDLGEAYDVAEQEIEVIHGANAELRGVFAYAMLPGVLELLREQGVRR